MITGVVYRYISPDGMSYVGQTTNEKRRKREFGRITSYRNKKLNDAIRKYGKENFVYEVLFRKHYESEQEAKKELYQKEEYYINFFDSYNNGFNMTFGGLAPRGFRQPKEQTEKQRLWLKEYYKTHDNPFKGRKHTEESKKILSEMAKLRVGEKSTFGGKRHSEDTKKKLSDYAKLRIGEKNHFFGKSHNESTKRKISEANSIPVVQIDVHTGEIIAEFESARAAGEAVGNPRLNSEIIKCCKEYISPSGKHYLTCKGFKWKYKNQ